jgi:hypothetical protein
MPHCCVTKSNPHSQPTPDAPLPNSAGQNQISFAGWGIAVWMLPKNPADKFPLSSMSPITATAAPLYERHCTLLI